MNVNMASNEGDKKGILKTLHITHYCNYLEYKSLSYVVELQGFNNRAVVIHNRE
jgi:hypothetical protein